MGRKSTQTLAERFIKKVNQPSGPDIIYHGENIGPCQLWNGAKRPGGYGIIRDSTSNGGKMLSAHRVSWELAYSPLPVDTQRGYQGTEVLHKCDVRLCVEPRHLFTGTQLDNIADAIEKNRAPQLQGKTMWTDEMRCKCGDAFRGQKHTEESKRKMRAAVASRRRA